VLQEGSERTSDCSRTRRGSLATSTFCASSGEPVFHSTQLEGRADDTDSQNLRPQDSLPFLRRISGDYQRARPSLDMSRPVSPVSTQLHDAPLSFESLIPLEAPAPPFAKTAGIKRDSLDSGYIASEEMPNVRSLLLHSTLRQLLTPRPAVSRTLHLPCRYRRDASTS